MREERNSEIAEASWEKKGGKRSGLNSNSAGADLKCNRGKLQQEETSL